MGRRGEEAEALVRAFLGGLLPRRFGVGEGFLIDAEDQVSKQTDVVIYDAFNSPVYRYAERGSIFPADNVASVVEVKSRLDGREFERGFENIKAAKSLRKHKSDPPLHSQTFGCVFAFESAPFRRKGFSSDT